MPTSVVMPALEMAQETGTLVAWLKKEGEHVAKGDLLLEVETDKATVEVEAQAEGVLSNVTAKPGDVIAVGQIIGWLLRPGETAPATTAPAQTGRRTDAAAPAAPAAAATLSSAPAAAGRMSPKARRLAEQHGVDLATIKGSGPGGEILADDILAAAAGLKNRPLHSEPVGAAGSALAQASADRPGLSTVARLMAERTTASWTTVPHFFLSRDVDAGALVALRERTASEIDRSHGVKLTQTDLIVAVVAKVLRKHPRVNSSWDNGAIRTNAQVNIGLAMAVDDGVVAVVMPNADGRGLGDLAKERLALTERARSGHLHPADLNGATFTISNLGMFGVDAFTAIIVQPQAAILAVGAIADRVVARGGQAVVRPTMTMTLSSDHRVVDGARAAAFMKDLVDALERPDL